MPYDRQTENGLESALPSQVITCQQTDSAGILLWMVMVTTFGLALLVLVELATLHTLAYKARTLEEQLGKETTMEALFQALLQTTGLVILYLAIDKETLLLLALLGLLAPEEP